MIAAVRAEVPSDRIATLHYERFSAPPILGGVPFELELSRTGRVIEVGAEQSALSAIRTVLPNVAYSCRQGFCGTCPVALLDGQVEHQDRCLTEPERATRFAPCVSRGIGRVVVEL